MLRICCLLLLQASFVFTQVASFETNHVDVAIMGAGPGGLSCALALSKECSSIAVYERAPKLSPIGAALGLSDRGYQALQDMGIAEQVRAQGDNPHWQIVLRPNGAVLYNDEHFFYRSSFTWLGWYALQTTIREALPPRIPIHLAHRLVSFEEDREQGLVRLHFQVGDDQAIKTTTCRVLIGADGIRSVVRNETVGDGPPDYTGTMTWRGIINRSDLPNNIFEDWCRDQREKINISVIGDGKQFAMMECGNGQVAWFGSTLRDLIQSTEKPSSSLDRALQVFPNWPELTATLMHSTDPSAVVETGVFDREPVASWGVLGTGKFSRVTLLGDAAHPIRPSLGLGSTLAFEDALCLAKQMASLDLRDSGAVQAALAAYEQERIEATAPLYAKARMLGEASHDEDRADQMRVRFETALQARQARAEEK
jgi:salicylate hydroxylase